MKIVYCIESLTNPGGMERVLTTKANYLAETYGYEVHIAVKGFNKVIFFRLSHNINCHFLSAQNKQDYRIKLEQLLFEIKADICISMCGMEFSFLYKIKDGSKKLAEFHFTKHYLTHLVNGIENLKWKWLHLIKAYYIQLLESYYAKHYERVILLTKQDLNIWGMRSNMTFIHNPLSFRSDKISSLSQKRIIAAGRFIAQKGFLLLIEAFRHIAKHYPDWVLDIYGDGQEKSLMIKRIEQYNLQKQIHILHPIQDIQKEFLKSAFFVFPSIYEGFGLVLTEALECGLPCIAFDCKCGPNEIIRNEENGYLVKNKDVYGFARKIEKLILNEKLREDMGKRAKQSVQQFYTEQIMPKWNNLFIEIVKKQSDK